jgi:hypothetical protein
MTGIDAEGLPMSDEMTRQARKKGRVVIAVIMSGWILCMLTMVCIVGTALYMLSRGTALPQELAQWVGIALGFLFGTFTTLVRDYITGPESTG